MLSKLINQVDCQLKIYNDDFFEYFFRRIFIAKFSDNYWILDFENVPMHQELLQNSLEVCEIRCSIDHLHKHPIRHDISAYKKILQ